MVSVNRKLLGPLSGSRMVQSEGGSNLTRPRQKEAGEDEATDYKKAVLAQVWLS